MGTYNFRSVGLTSQKRAESVTKKTQTAIGIKTPLRTGNDGGLFVMTYDLGEQLQDNLRNLLLTNWGERLGLYDFGANLRPILSEWVSLEDFDSAAFDNIATAISRWMPYITPQSYTSNLVSGENSTNVAVAVVMTYDIPTLSITNRTIEITLRVM